MPNKRTNATSQLSTAIIVLSALVALFASMSRHPHGLQRESIAENEPKYRLPHWNWPYIDGGAFAYGDELAGGAGIHLMGAVVCEARHSHRWRLRHPGGVRLVVDGNVLVDDQRKPSAVNANTTNEFQIVPAALCIQIGLDIHANTALAREVGRFEVALEEHMGGDKWRLIPTHRLYPTPVPLELHQSNQLRLHIARSAVSVALALSALLAAGWLHRTYKDRVRFGALLVPTLACVLALATRFAVLFERSTNDPIFWVPSALSDNYLMFARATLGGVSAVQGPMFAPGLTWWYILLSTAFGPSIWTLHVINIILAGIAGGLLAHSTAQVSGRSVGALAGLLYALYPPLIFYQTTLHVASVLPSVMAVAGALVLRAALFPGALRFGLLGAGLAIAALLRPTALALLPVIALLVALNRGQSWRAKGVCVAMLLLSAVAVIGPQAAINAPTPTSPIITNSGPLNLLIGNNRQASGAYGVSDAFNEARSWTAKTGNTMIDAVWREVTESPSVAIGLIARKFGLLTSGPETSNVLDYNSLGLQRSALLRLLSVNGIVSMSLLTILFIIGVLSISWDGGQRSRRPYWWLVIVTGAYAGATALIFVEGRIRIPLCSLGMPICALGVASVLNIRMWRRSIVRGLCAITILWCLTWCRNNLPPKPWHRDVPPGIAPQHVRIAPDVMLYAIQIRESWLSRGGYVAATLYSGVTQEVDHDAEVVCILEDARTGAALQTRRLRLGTLAWPRFGTSAWKAHRILAEDLYFRVPRDAPDRLRLRVYNPAPPSGLEGASLSVEFAINGMASDRRTRPG